MPYYCTVPRCTSMAGKAKNVSFHQFPRDEELAKLWNRILKRGKPYTKYSKVCSLHFKPEDYTITSVGKNKGQWRTLRKDAIPSQNLPSESPAPYTRRNTGYWAPAQPSLVDPMVQQQMAQAIYMQTMLAMQAAGASEAVASSDQPLQMPDPIKPSPSGSSVSEIELLLRKDPETAPKDVTYKCQECSKCFKDPDVFLLHKRTHKNYTLTNNIEKENYSANIQDSEETLRANPILANLLKSSIRMAPENSISSILTVENHIMTALASNMEAYIRTLTSMLTNQANPETSEDKSEDKSDDSDYEETRDIEDGNLHREIADEANKSECEDGNDIGNHDDDMGDTNGRDTPMDEDILEARDNVGNTNDTIYEHRNDTNIVQCNTLTSDAKSIDDTKDENVFSDANIKHINYDTSINGENIIDEMYESENDEHREIQSYASDVDSRRNEGSVQNDTSSNVNHTYPSDEIRNEADEENYDITNESEPTSDEKTDKTVYEGKDICKNDNLVQNKPDCDSIVDKVAINC